MSHVRYIDKTRDYYRNEGYETPYRWAHFDDIPFTPLSRPLARCRVGLVTSSEMAIVGEPGAWNDNDVVRDPYALPTSTPVARLYSRKEAYDRYATTLDDVDAYLPLSPLAALAAEGRIAGLAARFQVIYSNYSQRKTSERDAPEVLAQCRAMGVDVAILVPV